MSVTLDGVDRVATAMVDARLPPLVHLLVDAPYGVKAWAAQHARVWRYYTGACRRLGWNRSCLGWHTAKNGPFAGIRIEALHTNHVWAPAGLYEPAVAKCIVSLLEEPKIAAGEMWDVGANRGLISLLGARHGAAHVVAIELSPANIVMLRRQLAANPRLAARVDVVQAAASDGDGRIEILVNGHDGAICQIVAPGVRQYETTAATSIERGTARAIDSLVAERRARVGLLKIDVEGAEALVLKGAQRLLGEQAPVIVLEVHNEQAGRSSVDLLHAAGYACRRLLSDGTFSPLEDVVGYGHIVARADA